ncbi:phospholipase D-like domain-containing protein [Ralstonia mannitolilytica]|uniref:hypothetical protein n=1 Tax=Ralstonia mannitolilytica TaxID=105219 RepID=UPI002930D14C|nr:hypothetical protein [Ralstonia mannitolilytica]
MAESHCGWGETMSQDSEKLARSLAQHFDAPKDYVGHFGWLCGFSADAEFLDDAAERFTRLTSAQRQRQGRIALAVFLDPGNPPISLLDAPAVAHLPIKDLAKKPFRLLHAKVALLGFKHREDSDRWYLRLIVSTGNWTRQTLEESLDLAWSVGVSSEALEAGNDGVKQICADIKAANDLMQWIADLFDNRLLSATINGGFSETQNAFTQVKDWISSCAEKAAGQARFFDNRNESLLAQLSAKIKACGSGVARNYLAMGSGFYETAADQCRPPEIPKKIIETLKQEALLTKNPEIDIYVNPNACQSIAISVGDLNQQGVTVRPAGQPSSVFGDSARQRTLHAKFLFSANYRDNSPYCNSAWVYLGSGNLTNPGFANQMSLSAGNLEAGVVFAGDGLLWKDEKGVDKQQVVTNLLPIQWNDAVDSNGNQLSPGLGMESRDDHYVAPPVAWLSWHKADDVSELRATESVTPDFHVLDSTGNACVRTATGFLWKEAQPRQVCVRWPVGGVQQESLIPVMDQYGRIAATELPSIGVDEAWWQLADFPLAPDDDGDNPDDDENNGKVAKNDLRGKSAQPLSYPIRRMMELIENIAAKQTEINKMDWSLWCNRLEQTLSQAKKSAAVEAFLQLELNPLSPLRHAPFRPSFAETSESPEGQLYEDTLTRIEKSWKVDQIQMKAIGGAP